jgi:hypothetical protein
MPESIDPVEAWTVHDADRNNAHHFESRSDADEKVDEAEDLGIDVDLYPPGELPDGVDTQEAEQETTEEPTSETSSETYEDADPVDAEIIDHTTDPKQSHDAEYELEERSVGEDPLNWVPGEFVDTIDGSEAINRKGFEVLSHFYDIDVESTVVVPPEDTDHEYCRVTAVAETPEGRRCEAHGSAHVDRGDDHYLLLEMADTRARKRALSIATGVGAVAVEELRNEVGDD